jgi:hypothetical protein
VWVENYKLIATELFVVLYVIIIDLLAGGELSCILQLPLVSLELECVIINWSFNVITNRHP